MNRVSEKLSSLYLTAWTLVALLLWFGGGVMLIQSETFVKDFEQMNGLLVRHWLLASDNGCLFLKFWFLGLCLIMVVLGINLIFCFWTKILRIIRVKFNGPKFFMLIVHMIFGCIALGHFGGLMLGFEYDKIRLFQGQSCSFGNQYKIELRGIHFIDDPKVLNKSRRQLMRDEFHYRSNYADVVLERNGQEVLKDRIFVLRPIRHADIQITLKRFIPTKQEGNETTLMPGVVLSVSNNPVLKLFLGIYPIMILGIMIHLAMTWRTPGRSHVLQI